MTSSDPPTVSDVSMVPPVPPVPPIPTILPVPPVPDHTTGLEGRICPFISSGRVLASCLGRRCNACRRINLEEGAVWVCALIDRDFSDSWEVTDHVYA
ncbi:MAG: hypothetical protein LUQ50_15570 [Methanospirillum sp.]|uniref:hypothetical protein n=1 Tax=Methanospirillum sp. TaxID=45200 RepID=UPI0023691524|nr:hypothetical protein [Methanospirillum sp.]MDD1730473.1 hypothetical protein [Methanospirillum sp.]